MNLLVSIVLATTPPPEKVSVSASIKPRRRERVNSIDWADIQARTSSSKKDLTDLRDWADLHDSASSVGKEFETLSIESITTGEVSNPFGEDELERLGDWKSRRSNRSVHVTEADFDATRFAAWQTAPVGKDAPVGPLLIRSRSTSLKEEDLIKLMNAPQGTSVDVQIHLPKSAKFSPSSQLLDIKQWMEKEAITKHEQEVAGALVAKASIKHTKKVVRPAVFPVASLKKIDEEKSSSSDDSDDTDSDDDEEYATWKANNAKSAREYYSHPNAWEGPVVVPGRQIFYPPLLGIDPILPPTHLGIIHLFGIRPRVAVSFKNHKIVRMLVFDTSFDDIVVTENPVWSPNVEVPNVPSTLLVPVLGSFVEQVDIEWPAPAVGVYKRKSVIEADQTQTDGDVHAKVYTLSEKQGNLHAGDQQQSMHPGDIHAKDHTLSGKQGGEPAGDHTLSEKRGDEDAGEQTQSIQLGKPPVVKEIFIVAPQPGMGDGVMGFGHGSIGALAPFTVVPSQAVSRLAPWSSVNDDENIFAGHVVVGETNLAGWCASSSFGTFFAGNEPEWMLLEPGPGWNVFGTVSWASQARKSVLFSLNTGAINIYLPGEMYKLVEDTLAQYGCNLKRFPSFDITFAGLQSIRIEPADYMQTNSKICSILAQRNLDDTPLIIGWPILRKFAIQYTQTLIRFCRV